MSNVEEKLAFLKDKTKIMNKLFTLTAVFAFALGAFGAENDTVQKPLNPDWKLKSLFGLNLTQSSFTNWAAGGRNNLSGLGFANLQANYKKDKIKWDNRLNFALGGIQYLDDVEGDMLQKTDDVIDFQTNFGYGLKDPWYITILGGFKTQTLNGFTAATDSLYSSTFMAPGYVNLSLGIEYAPNDKFNVFVSPVSSKMTFVRDQRLANAGAFGVEPGLFDINGLLITPGEQFRFELGSYARILYNKELMENIQLKSRLELFSNYMNNPQNIDVNAEAIITFKVNSWFSASVQANLIYDDDITIRDKNGNSGPRTQFKQVIGVGLAYTMANYREKK